MNPFHWCSEVYTSLKASFFFNAQRIGFVDWLYSIVGKPLNPELVMQARQQVIGVCKFFEIDEPNLPIIPILEIKGKKTFDYAEYSPPTRIFKNGIIFIYKNEELLPTIVHELFHAMTPTFSRLSDYWAETFAELLEERASKPDIEIILPETPEQEYFYVLCCLLADKIKADPSDVTWTMFRRFLKDDYVGLMDFVDSNFKTGTFMLFENEESSENADFKRLLQEIAIENNCIDIPEEVKV